MPRSAPEQSADVPTELPTTLRPAAIADAIRTDIVYGRLAPGTRVTEAALAQRYSVSRMPIREVLRTLEAEGFVESRPNIGSTIARIPLDEADDLFAVREALEIATARRAADRACSNRTADAPDPEWHRIRKEIAEILDDGDAAVRRGDTDPLVALNDRLHILIALLSDSRTLERMLRQLSRKIEWLYALDTSPRGGRTWADHREILAAIDAGDPARAAELMGWHVRESRIGYAKRTASPERLEALRTTPPVIGIAMSTTPSSGPSDS